MSGVKRGDIHQIAVLPNEEGEMSDRTLTTHSPDCWSRGPKHYECAVGRVERLEEALRLIESAKARGFGIDYARGVAQSALLRGGER